MRAEDKPLFTVQDVSELLGVKRGDVARLARRLGVPVAKDDAAAGPQFSAWAVRQLIIGLKTGKCEQVRFDRQAILWRLMNGAGEPPTFAEAWEQELERVAQLPEPARTIRGEALWRQMREASAVATCLVERSSSAPSSPSSLGGAFSAISPQIPA